MTENKRYSLGKTGCYRTKLIIDNENGNELGNSIVVKRLNELNNEKEQYKQSATMYHNLFIELQKQLKGVKKVYDLDSKDFEGLIELSKGNVFDDKLGWIHLPVKEEFE